jgi:glutathione S-transferase
VPVLVLGGDAICDSKRILEHLEWRAAGGRDPA